MTDAGTRCMWMRGGTSKGGYFLAIDLPADEGARNELLLRAMGSPDTRQIDGMGGANPLTSKVAVVSASDRDDADVDYLFLQVFVDQAIVTDAQNCGNILAGVGGFAIERGLVTAGNGVTDVRIFMRNTGQVATASIATPDGAVTYAGDEAIDGVPGTSAPVPLVFDDVAGSMCGALLPTGNQMDVVAGVEVTMIDNGMPIVVLRAADMGITGYERPAELDADDALKARIEALRLACGPLMNLGDVREKSVPKMVAPAQ
jgi:4-oxalomesaconate tautomerase